MKKGTLPERGNDSRFL